MLHLHIVCFPVGSMENKEFKGKENSINKMLVFVTWKRSLTHVNNLQPGTHYKFGNKTVRLHNTNVWIWFEIIQHAESTWILELLVTG